MSKMTTIQVSKSVVAALNELKDHPKESYNEVIVQLVGVVEAMKKRNQYDEFLHKIQQPKMKEIWDNKEDEAWEHA